MTDPFMCLHKNLHPARVDGVRTVCLDCEQPVIVKTFQYASGKPIRQQYEELLEALREEYARHPHAYGTPPH